MKFLARNSGTPVGGKTIKMEFMTHCSPDVVQSAPDISPEKEGRISRWLRRSIWSRIRFKLNDDGKAIQKPADSSSTGPPQEKEQPATSSGAAPAGKKGRALMRPTSTFLYSSNLNSTETNEIR